MIGLIIFLIYVLITGAVTWWITSGWAEEDRAKQGDKLDVVDHTALGGLAAFGWLLLPICVPFVALYFVSKYAYKLKGWIRDVCSRSNDR